MKKSLQSFFRSTDGATAIEYGLIVAIIAVGIAGAMSPLRELVESLFVTVIAAFPD